jgi:hypothetical protein
MRQTRTAPWLTGRQAAWLIFQVIFVATLFGLSWVVHPDSVRLLWEDPAGVKMTVTAATCFGMAVAGFAVACVLLNRRFPPADPKAAVPRRMGEIVLAIVLTLLFMAPVVFVVTIGPAALQIQKSIMQIDP